MAKEILIKTKLKSTTQVKEVGEQHFHTNDIGSAELVFRVEDMTKEELSKSKAVIFLNMTDGSFFRKESSVGEVIRVENDFRYTLKENEILHTGLSEVQLSVFSNGKWYSSHLYTFRIVNGLDKKSEIEVEIKDLPSETRKEIAKLKSETNTIITDLSAQFQQVIDETTGKDVISAPEIISARNGEANLKARIDKDHQEVTAQLQQKKNSTEHYFPSTNIKAVDGSDGINAKTITYNQLIALIDSAVSGINWITKRTITRDSSDTYNVYAYDIVPNKYNDYIVADGNMHGDGPNGDPKDVAIALYYLIKDVVENHDKNDKLITLLNTTNLCIIPVANPWGYDNDSRYTANGVDINRNFNYNHTPSDVGGLTPFSENETIGLRDNMRTILNRTKNSNAKVLGYISYHAFGGSHIKYPPEFIQLLSTTTPALPAFENARQYLLRKYGYVARFSEVDVGTMPSSDNYMERVFGVPSGTAEMIVYRNDGKERSAEAMTQHVEYYGDILYQIVNLSIKPKKKLSIFKASERKTFEPNTTSKIKFSPSSTTENYFETDVTGENIIVPSYVDYVKAKVTVNLFNEKTYKNFPIAVYVYVNDSLVYSGPTLYESDVSMGYDGVNTRKRTHTVNLSTPPIYIPEGVDTKVNVQVYNGNDTNIMLGVNLATTWLSVEEYIRYN